MAFIVMSREVSYGDCNCSCFETDEVFGPFETEKEAEAWGKKQFRSFSYYRVRELKSEKAHA